MAEEKKGFVLYADQYENFKDMPDEVIGKLMRTIYEYVNDMNPVVDDMLLKALFNPIKAQLKRDLKKWENKCGKNRENAHKRWNKKDANACERMPTNAKHADNDTDNVTVNVNDSEIEKTPATFEEIYLEIKNSDRWLETICFQKKILPAEISKHLDEFMGDIRLKEDWHKGLKEVKEHFINWLNLRLKEKSNGTVTSAVSKY